MIERQGAAPMQTQQHPNSRYWIVGGEYTDTAFTRLVDGTERVMGPYPCRTSAMQAWQALAEQTRSNCHARFAIAEEARR
jgi:hypothetical protein